MNGPDTNAHAGMASPADDLYGYLDALPHQVWLKDRHGAGVVWYNQRWYAYSGLSQAQALGEGGAHLVHEDDRAGLQAHWNAALGSQQPFEVAARLRARGGEYRWFSMRGEPVWREGCVVAWIGTNTDIEVQHHSESKAQRARSRVEGLQRVTAALSQALSSDAVIAASLEHGLETVGAYAGSVVLLADDGVRLELRGQRGYDPATLERLHDLTVHSDVQVAATVRDLQAHFMNTHEYAKQMLDSQRYVAPRSRAVATLPLAVAGRATGALAIGFDHERTFSKGERRFLTSLADATAQALERARLFDAALRVQERFEAALASSRTGIWEYDPSTREIVYGGYYAELYGLPSGPGRVHAGVVSAYTPPEDREGALEATRRAFERGDWLEREFRVRVPGSPERWVFSRGRASATPDGPRLVGTVTDITERRRAEEALKDSELNFRALADSIPQLAWMAHSDGEIFWYNQRWFDYTGTTLDDMRGWGWQRVHDPEHLPGVLERWRASLQSGEPFELEFPLRGADGAYKWFLTRVNPVRGADGQVWRWFGTNTDITAAMEVQRQLRAVGDSQRRFVSDAAHELRAPLTGIRGNLELVRRFPQMDPAERDQALLDAEREAGRLARLITDLLEVARGDARSAQRPELEPVALGALLSEALRGAAHLGAHPLSSDLEDVTVLGDRDRLKQLTLILLENAMKYSPADTPVHLRSCAEPGWARIEIVDRGPGIAPEHLERVFERFYRADSARTPGVDPGGTGLGLPIARMIAEAHGGSVHLDSALGLGTTAVVRLPLAASSLQP
jgi:hypothetical protein